MLSGNGGRITEVVPDSEEERISLRPEKVSLTSTQYEVIELSSDEDEDDFPGIRGIPGSWNPQQPGGSRSSKTAIAKRSYLRSRVIESSESDNSVGEGKTPCKSQPNDIIELTDSSDDDHLPERRVAKKNPPFVQREEQDEPAEEDNSSMDDGAIIIFDEPKSARKPKMNVPSLRYSKNSDAPGTSLELSALSKDVFEGPLGALGTPVRSRRGLANPVTPSSNLQPNQKSVATPRSKTKKKVEEQQRLYTYATLFFKELNRVIFNNGLPEDTQLNWNKRLLTTAGRAKWNRSRDGVQTSEIELSEKILTCDKRIRNTLSHEMCHLASWVIDGELKEGHGKFWKSWTRKVMRKYPEIDISTRHDYEISYPYTWKCEKCSKIYGRFSKSIRPDECVCGACREGKLIPQFQTNNRTPKTPKTSRMAAAKAQDSPCYIVRKPTEDSSAPKERGGFFLDSNSDVEPGHSPVKEKPARYEVTPTDSDSDIEVLTTAMGGTTITAD